MCQVFSFVKCYAAHKFLFLIVDGLSPFGILPPNGGSGGNGGIPLIPLPNLTPMPRFPPEHQPYNMLRAAQFPLIQPYPQAGLNTIYNSKYGVF